MCGYLLSCCVCSPILCCLPVICRVVVHRTAKHPAVANSAGARRLLPSPCVCRLLAHNWFTHLRMTTPVACHICTFGNMRRLQEQIVCLFAKIGYLSQIFACTLEPLNVCCCFFSFAYAMFAQFLRNIPDFLCTVLHR